MTETPLWKEWQIRHVATHCDGNALVRSTRFCSGLFLFVVELVVRRPDLVHLHVSHYGSFFRKALLTWIAAILRVPVVFHIHGSNFADFFEGSAKPFQFMIRRTLEQTSCVVVLGNKLRNAILRDIAPKAYVQVVPNSIKPGKAVDHAVSGPVHAVFVGEVCERKGIPVLLDAWARLVAGFDPLSRPRLTIAGDGDIEAARRRVRALGLDDSVDVLGWIPPAGVHDLLTSSQVLVLPSFDEGQPMAILEAMAMGLCVVSTTAGEIPEMISAVEGVLTNPGDVAELTEALSAVLQDQEARHRYGRNARRRVETGLNVNIVSRRLSTIYRGIVVGSKQIRATGRSLSGDV